MSDKGNRKNAKNILYDCLCCSSGIKDFKNYEKRKAYQEIEIELEEYLKNKNKNAELWALNS